MWRSCGKERHLCPPSPTNGAPYGANQISIANICLRRSVSWGLGLGAWGSFAWGLAVQAAARLIRSLPCLLETWTDPRLVAQNIAEGIQELNNTILKDKGNLRRKHTSFDSLFPFLSSVVGRLFWTFRLISRKHFLGRWPRAIRKKRIVLRACHRRRRLRLQLHKLS